MRAAVTLLAGASSTPADVSAPFLIDTDCGLDDLSTLAIAIGLAEPPALITTCSGLAPPGHGHLLAGRLLSSLTTIGLPTVVAGAEEPPATVSRMKDAWELTYQERVAEVCTSLGIEHVTPAQAQVVGSAAAAADAIVDAAGAAGESGVVILALGAMTNLAAAAQRHPAAFTRSVRRIIFIAARSWLQT
jgi:inosine-uridine nucleoside N-ribohydrolase